MISISCDGTFAYVAISSQPFVRYAMKNDANGTNHGLLPARIAMVMPVQP